jgi:hypothetical protein
MSTSGEQNPELPPPHPPPPPRPRLNLEIILFECGLFYHILPYLSWSDVIPLESMNSLFYSTIRSSEPLWREILSKFFQTKCYLRTIVRRFLTDGNRLDHRVDLIKMTIKELKSLAYSYGLNITTCFEKSDLISVIHKREIKFKLRDECLAHYGLRIAWLDRKRNYLTEEDLCSYEWNIRVRADGPLKSLVSNDPWWSESLTTPSSSSSSLSSSSASTTTADGVELRENWRIDQQLTDLTHLTNELTVKPREEEITRPTTTLMKFFPTGEFKIIATGPTFLESLISDPNERFSYALEKAGTLLSLSIGVKEYVARHPTNWGFILQSQGTVWTNYPMPSRGKDELLEDENVSLLVSRVVDYGPCI